MVIQNPENINLNNELYSDKFKLIFPEVKGMELLCTGVSFPSLDANPQEVPNSLNKIYVQGTKLNYTPLTVQFKVDENLSNYKEIFAWLVAIHAPQSFEQFAHYQQNLRIPRQSLGHVVGYDASLVTLKNSHNVNIEANFVHLFPTSLTGWEFGMSAEEHIIASATFQFDYFLFK